MWVSFGVDVNVGEGVGLLLEYESDPHPTHTQLKIHKFENSKTRKFEDSKID